MKIQIYKWLRGFLWRSREDWQHCKILPLCKIATTPLLLFLSCSANVTCKVLGGNYGNGIPIQEWIILKFWFSWRFLSASPRDRMVVILIWFSLWMIVILSFPYNSKMLQFSGADGPDHGGGAPLPGEAGGAEDCCCPGIHHHHHHNHHQHHHHRHICCLYCICICICICCPGSTSGWHPAAARSLPTSGTLSRQTAGPAQREGRPPTTSEVSFFPSFRSCSRSRRSRSRSRSILPSLLQKYQTCLFWAMSSLRLTPLIYRAPLSC